MRNKTTQLHFASVIDFFFLLPVQSESVKYFLDNLDRIGQLVSHIEEFNLKCTLYFFTSFDL